MSRTLLNRARRIIPGGVNSPVRAFGGVGGTPYFVASAKGATVTDTEGRSYVDHVASWGPMILGHAPAKVLAAVRVQLARGTSYGAPTEIEIELAEAICNHVASVQMVRMVSSGTEATMSALRLARGFTKRDRIVKFTGCYHGHADGLLAAAGSGLATFAIPSTPGVPAGTTADTLICPYNDPEALEKIFRAHGETIAAVILEPVAGNMGVVPPRPGFLKAVRAITKRHGALLIFDEVITGFRLGLKGAQGMFNVRPDLTCFGKIIGGGFPVGAYGGSKKIMEHLAPVGPVYQAGTLSGNPVAMTAGLATLEALAEEGVYEAIEEKSAYLAAGLAENVRDLGCPVTLHRVGSMLCTFFHEGPIRNYEEAALCDTKRYAVFFHEMLARGVAIAPSQFETMFVGLAHTKKQLDQTVDAHRAALKKAFA